MTEPSSASSHAAVKPGCHSRTREPAPLAELPPSAPEGLSPEDSLENLTIPDRAACEALWETYAMPAHIREHSRLVARIAQGLCRRALEVRLTGAVAELPALALASGLLHDLAKAYTIAHGGNHALIGGAWVMRETGNPAIAQAVAHHVHWPWANDLSRYFLALALIYADKRVRHDAVVSLDDRYEDLLSRYGTSEAIRQRILATKAQARTIEAKISQALDLNLAEDERCASF